jgi:hypothetical protein
MYNYYFELTPSKPYSTIDFTSNNIYETLITSAENVNNGLAFKRGGKSILITDIQEKKIYITLSCQTALIHAARSLSAFTRSLTTHYPSIYENEIYNKTLFSMKLLSQESCFGPEMSDISDADLLKGMVDLLYTYTTTTKKEADLRMETIKNMKKLIRPFLNK